MIHMEDQYEYEYEERAFLTEDNFTSILQQLDRSSLSKSYDNKQSYFFVLPEINVSIAASNDNVKAKYKGGQLGLGNGFQEKEFHIQPESLSKSIEFFEALLGVVPQASYQFRINYSLGDNVEVALKYTEMWGFHIELERTYTANTSTKAAEEKYSIQVLSDLADKLGVAFITDEEMIEFKKQCAENKLRGTYSTDAFKDKYGSIFSL